MLNGQLYAAGGHDGPLVRKSVEVFDPTTNTWRQVCDMNMCRRNAGEQLQQDKSLEDGKCLDLNIMAGSTVDTGPPTGLVAVADLLLQSVRLGSGLCANKFNPCVLVLDTGGMGMLGLLISVKS